MKEVLTKSFWQGVKKTFYEAMEPEPPKAKQENAATPPSELPPDPPPPPAAPADN